MANKIRIVKKYNHLSPKSGIEEADVVEIEGGAEGAAMFVSKINANHRIDYQIIDWEIALISKMERPEVLTNRTGGGTGKLIMP
tara:strand:- start:109 stop:360 length:252 start_codon:yes stop_codon:yes gene_type:complete